MEPRFEVRTVTDKALFLKLVRFDAKHWRIRLFRIFYLLLALFYFYQIKDLFNADLLYWLLHGGYSEFLKENPVSAIIAVLAVPFGLYLIIRSVFFIPMAVRRVWKNNKNREGDFVVSVFFDDHFTSSSKNVSSVVQYGEICALEESSEIFFLKRTKTSGVSICKSDFTAGSPEDFRAFIEEKTGKKIKFIR